MKTRKPAAAKKIANKKENLTVLEQRAKQKGITSAYRGTYYPNGPTPEYLMSKGYTENQAQAFICGFKEIAISPEKQMERFVGTQIKNDRYAGMITETRAKLIKRFQSWDKDAIEEYIRQTSASNAKKQADQNINEEKLKNFTQIKLTAAVNHSISQGSIPCYTRFETNYKFRQNPELIKVFANAFTSNLITLDEYFDKYKLAHKSKSNENTNTLSPSDANDPRVDFLTKYNAFINKLIFEIKPKDNNGKLHELKNKITEELKKCSPAQYMQPKKAPAIFTHKRKFEEEKSQSSPQNESYNVDKYYKELTASTSIARIQRLFNFVRSLKDYIIVHHNIMDNDRLGYLVYLYCLIIKLKSSYRDEESITIMQQLATEVIDPARDKIQKKNLSYYLPQEGKDYRRFPRWYMEQHTRVERLEEMFVQLAPFVQKNDDAKSASNFDQLTQFDLHDSDYLKILSAKDITESYITLASEKNKFAPKDNLLTRDTEALLLANLGVVNAAIEKTIQSLKHKESNKIFCAIRPPSHHAQHDHAAGFCLMNTVVFAAMQLMEKGHKVMVIDFDVHHGDGNYAQFMKIHDEHKNYRSLYRLIDVYIEAQYARFIEAQPSKVEPKYSKNISLNELKEGYTGLALLNTIKRAVEKFAFKPDVVLVCAGFDALKDEKFHGGVKNPQDFYAIGAYLASLSDNVISFLEGGYKLQLLAQSVFYYVLGTGTLLPDDDTLPMLENDSNSKQIVHLVTNRLECLYQKAKDKEVTTVDSTSSIISNNKNIKPGARKLKAN